MFSPDLDQQLVVHSQNQPRPEAPALDVPVHEHHGSLHDIGPCPLGCMEGIWWGWNGDGEIQESGK